MDFSFSQDQLDFRDAVRDLLAKECPPEVVRAAYPAPPADRPGEGPGAGARADASAIGQLWAALAEMGVFGIAAPESLGGFGLTELDWVLLAEEAGYAAVPGPFVEALAVAIPLLADVDAELAGSAIAGEARVTAALAIASPLPWTSMSTHALVRDGSDLAAVDLSAMSLTSVDGIDRSRSLAALDSSTLVGSSRRLGLDEAVVAQAFDRGALAAAAQLVGLARRMLELTVGYVVERQQFGGPIGAFQAVKHHLADARLQLEFAAPAVYAAAWAMATGQPDARRDVSLAKAMASDAARVTARNALQCHGAIGYTVEYDLHLYFKRAFALSVAWGDAAWHRDRVGLALGI